MSIRDRRLATQIDSIIRRNLAKGYVPTSNEVVSELSKYIAQVNLNAPSYKFARKDRGFTAKTIEETRKATLGDLNLIYDSLLELHQLSEEQIEKFSVEKKKHDYMLSSIESELTNLINRYSSSSYTQSFREAFSDMENIDLAKTTADIDITNHEATLKKLYDVPYTSFKVRVDTTPGTLIYQNGNIEDFIEADGVVWQGIIEKDLQEPTGISITIDLGEETSINRIELEMPLLKKASLNVFTSLDNDTWAQMHTGEISSRSVISLTGMFRYIKVVLTKTEADKMNLTKFQYYFIVDGIKLSTVNYTYESDIVSKPIKVDTNINKVSIVDTSSIPHSTSIQYYVAANSDNPQWVPITPVNWTVKDYPDIVTFNSVDTDQRLTIKLPPGISNDAYEMKNLSVNGQRIFAIGSIDGRVITGYRLYKGMNAWKVENIAMNAGSEPQTQSLFIGARNIATSYIPMVTDKAGLILNNHVSATASVKRFTTTVYRESSDSIEKAMLASTHPVTVYLNGNIVYKGAPSGAAMVTYPLKKGLNVVEVIVNLHNTNPSLVDLNLNITGLGSIICANKEPMTPVSLFNLRYNTNNQYDVYTLYKANEKSTVMVKDPDTNIAYDLIYDYVSDPVKEMLVKTTLKRERINVNTTPRLLSYEVRMV